MADQLGFFDITPASKPTDRLFFGVMPDGLAANRATVSRELLCRDYAMNGRPIAIDRLHITLIHIGDYFGVPAGILRDAKAAAEHVPFGPFAVTLDRAESFIGKPEQHPCVLRGAEGLVALRTFQHLLSLAMHNQLVRYLSMPSNLHMTLLYDPVVVPEKAIEPISWTVHEFVLVHSELGQTKYHILGRWPLLG